MNTHYIQTLIIRARPAGPATGYHLRRRGRPLPIVDAPGLYFCGLSCPYAVSSMAFPSISRGADYSASQIVARPATVNPAAA
jgi:hypothetical protein